MPIRPADGSAPLSGSGPARIPLVGLNYGSRPWRVRHVWRSQGHEDPKLRFDLPAAPPSSDPNGLHIQYRRRGIERLKQHSELIAFANNGVYGAVNCSSPVNIFELVRSWVEDHYARPFQIAELQKKTQRDAGKPRPDYHVTISLELRILPTIQHFAGTFLVQTNWNRVRFSPPVADPDTTGEYYVLPDSAWARDVEPGFPAPARLGTSGSISFEYNHAFLKVFDPEKENAGIDAGTLVKGTPHVKRLAIDPVEMGDDNQNHLDYPNKVYAAVGFPRELIS
ncbi:uncharacterized protein BDR25DRAFT_356554 [Lindgomyces ingoldianus]|uniref:Uncharacterized protein n=1 Tax=Lindgomyces ingoldianus TaxID=673940 RepID=A0ACB6QQP2_9PLEO|nr:uncharacterized protein BDR25DRAFT_356554 [Lindgomyces ingoldianus]KAF2469314.1 hypothetical protein BDR25DRAFT_356554 [Lindgomyces ingoldianus]